MKYQKRIIFGSIILILLLWGGSWLYVNHSFPDTNENYLTDRGTFGDQFGFINSLFSGLALTGIIISIYFQQYELSLQRRELTATREEFRNQNFQSTFFNLLRTQRQIIDEISCSFKNLEGYKIEQFEKIIGRKFFLKSKVEIKHLIDVIKSGNFANYSPWNDEHQYEEPQNEHEHNELVEYRNRGFILSNYRIKKEVFSDFSSKSELEIVKFSYGAFLNKYHFIIGHYFRHLYHILCFLEQYENEMEKEDSVQTNSKKVSQINQNSEIKRYSDFIQAQLSTPEMFLIFYNCLKFPKLKNLIVKYKILENLNKEDLIEEYHSDYIPDIVLKSNKRFFIDQ